MCFCSAVEYTFDSKDRFGATEVSSTNSFTVQFANSITISKIKLKYVCLPNTIYSVSTSNNIIPFNEGGADKFASLTPQAYTMSALMAAIGSAMTITSGVNTYLATYDSTRFRLSIYEQTGTVNFRLLFKTYSTLSPLAPVINWPLLDSQVPAPSFTSQNAIDLNPRILYINIPELGKINHNATQNYTFSLPISANTNDAVLFVESQAYNQQLILKDTRIVNQLTFELRDRKGALVDIHHSDWFLIVDVE